LTHADDGVLVHASSSDDDAPLDPWGQAKQMEWFVHFIGDRVAWNSLWLAADFALFYWGCSPGQANNNSNSNIAQVVAFTCITRASNLI
jgi:hypothetical protein